MRGKHFIIRSLFCSALSEAVTSLIVLPVIFHDKGMHYITSITTGTVLIARFLVAAYRYVDNIHDPIYNTNLILNTKLEHAI